MFSRRFLLEETIMRLLIQRVLEAKVTVDGNTTGEIGKGLLVFIGAGREVYSGNSG